MKGKTIILGITGGIAAYKGAALCSKLVQAGFDVHVIMTENACQFITPLTLQTLSRNLVYTDTFDERDPAVVSHIDLADRADLILVAPATANTIAKMANGLADDMLSTTLLAATCPIVVAPAMNVHMYSHPAVIRNIQLLAERNVRFIAPETGQLACGYVAKGRLAEPESIVASISDMLREGASKPLLGKKVLITAGGTVERLDPVRYLTNDSSGKMGFALAAIARDYGAEVTLVMGRTSERPPDGVSLVRVESAQDMLKAVLVRYPQSDMVIKSAAVADYRPVMRADKKMKKSGDRLVLELEKTTDILQTLGEQKTKQYLVGFAAETEELDRYAMDKLQRKQCDLIVGNDVSQEGAGFNSDTNIIRIYDKDGIVESLPLLSKLETARRIIALAAERMANREAGKAGR
ncbi:bifunctional phosphopantothenoylcysteine decarboxylase/phosphopantothenate--cysteine ligase CoaBC [Paenibacillus sp. MMS18-CY102]|uniref:bifunctional phosphopantothenoylcysteine decarboxylase/phosphopantothenate--cysteine ligase CoaBC n=1 Tax=Paenibacillus sp. MMS18-CY102 TaxID=2682849 RepID=UPI001365DA3A|nr:bifunctional phosphopantothenoylcysteine decarboxylase/phosphopantothenate--cysteine ligase CoaBC [Paenibacillus sp. MMS18-CY102]MWC26720.1 bifunctional phosphopantothenoylcysteine decarboxylase/phosphopantothenate--cysteine ligase CoaBC [Paenibacillus sp. MMS18-CY102]